MGRTVFFFLGIGLLCVLSGCAKGGSSATHGLNDGAQQHLAGMTRGGAQGRVPAGMQLGKAYISALGESCYEVIPVQSAGSSGQAICLRGDAGWELLPAITMNTPSVAVR